MKKRLFLLLGFVLLLLACQTLIPPQAEDPAPAEPAQPNPPIVESPQAGSAGMGDSYYPQFGNGGYDVQTYHLNIEIINVETSQLQATTTIEAIALQTLSSFNLDFAGFEITQILVNQTPAEFTRKGQELTVTPTQALAQDSTFTVAVTYRGIPEEMISKAIHFPTGWTLYEEGIYVLSEPDGSASFYPVNDHPLDKALYTIIVTVPKPFEVAANGILQSEVSNEETTTYTFTVRDPMASYLTTINVSDFNIETMPSPIGIPIRNYYAASLPANINQPFARQGEMLAYFSEIFGPYPFEVYGSLVMDTSFGSALENQTLSIYGIDMIDLNNVEDSEYIVVHELAHQWFGDSISVADWSDIWLNEGFATYSEGLWIEHLYGRAELDIWMQEVYDDVENYPDFYPPPGNPPAGDLFNEGVYMRGGLTLHALRLQVGDEDFFTTLRTYYDRYQLGNATTEDFIAVAEEISGQDLKDFFNDWLYNQDLPRFP